jgi:hypothetical protein
MSFVDIVLMVVIISGAVYLLYRSVWKKKGHCMECDSGVCSKGNKKLSERRLGNESDETCC